MKLPGSNERLYRRHHNSVISGVCAGIAQYLSVDPLWVRGAALITLFMMPAVTMIAYIAAVVLLPRSAL